MSPLNEILPIRPSTPCARSILALRVAFSVSVGLLRSLTVGFSVGLSLAFLSDRRPCFILKVAPSERLFAASSAEIERVAALPSLYCKPSLTVPVTTKVAGLVEVASVIVEMLVAFASPNELSKTFGTIVLPVVPWWTFVLLI